MKASIRYPEEITGRFRTLSLRNPNYVHTQLFCLGSSNKMLFYLI